MCYMTIEKLFVLCIHGFNPENKLQHRHSKFSYAMTRFLLLSPLQRFYVRNDRQLCSEIVDTFACIRYMSNCVVYCYNTYHILEALLYHRAEISLFLFIFYSI